MWLTKNEKMVIKLLLEDGKISDTSMANELKISIPAIGRIRKRLEEDVIKRYSVDLDIEMLKLKIISVIKFKFLNLNLKQIEEAEKEIIQDKKIINLLKLTDGDGYYLAMCGCKSLEELNELIFYKKKEENNFSIQVKETHIFPLKGVLKNSFKDISDLLIDSCGIKNSNLKIN